MYKHAEFYRVDGKWYSYVPSVGEEYLAPEDWSYLQVLNLLSSSGWNYVGSRTLGGKGIFTVRKEVEQND